MSKDVNKKVTREGSGRTKGSVSFVTVPLEVLCSKIKDPTTPIKVSRLQLEAMGFIAKKSDPTKPAVITDGHAPKPVIKVTDFNEPAEPVTNPKTDF